MKVLLDTDIGSDIDDAACLAWLLRQPACELMGITTVSGHPRQRACIASAMLHAEGRTDVPIHAGMPGPIWGGNIQPHCPQYRELGSLAHHKAFEPGTAVPFLRDTIRAHPGEITLLAIGPMSNVGTLFAMDPEIPSLLRGLVMMCGSFTDALRPLGYREWNAKADPIATARVYGASCPIHRSFGLDVTIRVQMEKEAFLRKAQADPLLRIVAQLSQAWFAHSEVITFHDPLAAIGLFDADVCQYARGDVRVLLDTEDVAGGMDFVPSSEGRHEVATEVDAQRFFDRYFELFDA